MALRRPPRDPPGGPRRPHPLAGQPPGLVPELAGLPRARPRADDRAGPALPRPPRPGPVARLQRVRLPQPAVLLRHLRRGLPPLASGPLRRARRPQRRLGHRLLEPALHGLGPDPPAAAHHDVLQPHPRARLLALRVRHPARLLPRGEGDPERALPRGAGDDQLHDADALPPPRLPRVGARAGRRQHRPLRDREPRAPSRRARLRRRPHPRPVRRPAVAAHGALDERGQLAAGQPRQGPRPDHPRQPGPRRPRRRHDRLLPVAAVALGLGEVPLRPGAARRPRQRAVPRGLRARRDRRASG